MDEIFAKINEFLDKIKNFIAGIIEAIENIGKSAE